MAPGAPLPVGRGVASPRQFRPQVLRWARVHHPPWDRQRLSVSWLVSLDSIVPPQSVACLLVSCQDIFEPSILGLNGKL